MAQVIVRRSPKKGDVYCYDDVTDKDEVNDSLHQIVKEHKMSKNIWVISGTHGTSAGTVDPTCEEVEFKKEDLDSARVTSKNIHILAYHLLAPNRWAEIGGKAGDKTIYVLAFCYSSRWLKNIGTLGNDGKI